MTENHLTSATSPYLLQHKDNPVDWYPWGEEALAAARREDKPILLSVGYAACHWCHVMAHESFEDPDIAAYLNKNFISIKVDREERPDIDQVYMTALYALGGQGGWPLTMFLSPSAEPFWGGTYFPRHGRWGRPGFMEILKAVIETYTSDRNQIESNRQGLMKILEKHELPPTGALLTADVPVRAGKRLLAVFDKENGSIEGAPKFPQAPVLDLVWRTWLRSGDEEARNAFLLTLRQISNGGIYDHLGGGISRYSVDDRWLVPHFEKMLYDNAQYLDQLVTAWIETHEPLFLIRIEETAAWLLDVMQLPCGGFASSLDADSDGSEGRFYVWTPDEIITVLGPEDGTFFNTVYNVTPAGNWEGANILNRLDGVPVTGEQAVRIAGLKERLRSHRAKRPLPAMDDKILADWNGLAIAALARAGRVVSRESWIEAAERAFRFISESMISTDGRLAHSHRAGTSSYPGFASDYANMMRAALTLTESRPGKAVTYMTKAEYLGRTLLQHYRAPNGGLYMTDGQDPGLIVRPLTHVDEAVPNANSVAIDAFMRLYMLTGNDDFRDAADDILIAFSEATLKNILSAASFLSAFDTRLNARTAMLISPSPIPQPNPFFSVLNESNDPAIIRFEIDSTSPLHGDHPARGKTALGGKPTLYLCKEGSCSAPMVDPKALRQLLDN